ncbi:hypothetical protein BS78_02G356400 [Paspalum vaginatum]|nr:hypothetical protein BS78_02G356400 [Paspalum vaginatum]
MQDTNPLIHPLSSIQGSNPLPLPGHKTLHFHPSLTLGLWPPMASTASDSSPPSPGAGAPASAFLDDHPLFHDAAGSSFFPAATTSQEPPPPAPASSSAARKPPRKRPRASRRPPTTVVTTDTSNFRAMVQEFTGIPAPPPLAPHLGPGVLFGAPHGGYPARAPFELLMRPSPLKLTAAPPSASPPAGSFAHSLFANANSSSANPPGSSSESYGGGFAPTLSGAVVPPRYDGGFEAAEDERVGHDHGLFSSFLHAGDRYHSH